MGHHRPMYVGSRARARANDRPVTSTRALVLALILALCGSAAAGVLLRPASQAAQAPQPASHAEAGAAAPAAAVTAAPPARARAAVRSRALTTYPSNAELLTVAGSSAIAGTGPLRRYRVQVERGLALDPAAFARQVQLTLGDPRGWAHGGRLSFQRVASGPVAFTVVLAGPTTTNRLCSPLRTGGIFSCFMRGRAVINARRWFEGAATYGGHLAEYRSYVLSHEVGHALGHGHVYRCGSRGLAQTMIQQTKSLRGCARNAWPYP